MNHYDSFLSRLERLLEEVSEVAQLQGLKPNSVRLLPVTKTHPERVVQWVSRAGLVAVGENRVQEAQAKQAALEARGGVRWELIGHLQSNKARVAAEVFDRIQSVDSEKLLRKLDRASGELGKCLQVLLQFNAGDDPAKFGVWVEGGEAFLEAALNCKHLQVDGLMTIAPFDENPAVAARCFNRLRDLRDRLEERFGVALPELSMGMTSDFREAIAAGSTQIRVGTALFGARPQP